MHSVMERLLFEIYEEVKGAAIDDDPSLLGGAAGRLLFIWFLSKKYTSSIDAAHFHHLSAKVVGQTSNLEPLSFGAGQAGVAYAFELMLQEQTELPEHAAALATFDSRIRCAIERHPEDGDYEYVRGICGAAVYLARRARLGNAVDAYRLALDKLIDRAIPREGGLSWPTPSLSKYRLTSGSDPEFNLGLAHGVPGVISVLLSSLESGLTVPRAKGALIEACAWLESAQQDHHLHLSYYSYVAGERRTSRLGWCYGDLPIAMLFARAATALGEPAYQTLAQKIAANAASRTDSATGVVDSALCHGSAGVALMLDILARRLSDEYLAAASTRWMEQLMNAYQEQGISGLGIGRYHVKGGKRIQQPSTGILTGLSGVGLIILARLGVAPSWLDMVMLG